MKRVHLFGAGAASAALLMSGSVLADAPSGHTWNNYEANLGVITLQPDGVGGSNCAPPACVVLLNEVGMIQARVREDNDPNGTGYFQTVTVGDTFTGPAAAADFTNESFVAAVDGAYSLAALNRVDLSGEGIMQVELADGGLQDTANNEAGMVIWQENLLGTYGAASFAFEKQTVTGAQFSTNTAAGSSLRIDQTVNNVTGDRGTPFTIRQTSGFYTADSGTLELADGTTSIAYAQGDHIGTMYMSGLLWHGGPMHSVGNEHRAFEVQSVNNFTTAEGTNWTNVNNTMDDTGVGYVNFVAVWADEFAGNPNLWNANFGTAPTTIPSGGVPSAALNGTGAFPDFPDHTP